ncbi:MAG: hypothetical protein Kow0074_15750 [Candidatus Zixiibacteriota bacterium]
MDWLAVHGRDLLEVCSIAEIHPNEVFGAKIGRHSGEGRHQYHKRDEKQSPDHTIPLMDSTVTQQPAQSCGHRVESSLHTLTAHAVREDMDDHLLNQDKGKSKASTADRPKI